MSIEKSCNFFENRTPDFPACSTVLQPTTLPRDLPSPILQSNFHTILSSILFNFQMDIFQKFLQPRILYGSDVSSNSLPVLYNYRDSQDEANRLLTHYQSTRRHISEDSILHRAFSIMSCGVMILCVRGWCPAGVPTLPLPPATFFTTWPVDLDAPPAVRWLVQRAGMKQCSLLRKKTFLWRGSPQAELMCCVLWDRTWPSLLPGELLALLVSWRF
jgi:hypothetical protein